MSKNAAQIMQTIAQAQRAVDEALRGQRAAFEACRKSLEALQQAQEALQQAQEGLQALAAAETLSNTSERLDALHARLWGRTQGNLFDSSPATTEDLSGPLAPEDLGPLALDIQATPNEAIA